MRLRELQSVCITLKSASLLIITSTAQVAQNSQWRIVKGVKSIKLNNGMICYQFNTDTSTKWVLNAKSTKKKGGNTLTETLWKILSLKIFIKFQGGIFNGNIYSIKPQAAGCHCFVFEWLNFHFQVPP